MVILFSLPVALSLAETCRMPLASMSKVTSICGMPRGAGGMSERLNWPRLLLPEATSRSPCSTWMVTALWLSSAVEKTWTGLGRDRRVLLDQLGHDAAQGLDAQRQRGHVEQQHVLDFALQHAALDGGADGDGFVRVDVLARFLAEEFLDLLLHLGHAGLAADQDHVVDVADLAAGILDRDAAGRDGALDQFFDQRFELGAGDLDRQVLRTGGVGGDVGQVDFGLLAGGQLDLGLFGRFLEALQGQHVVSSGRRRVPS